MIGFQKTGCRYKRQTLESQMDTEERYNKEQRRVMVLVYPGTMEAQEETFKKWGIDEEGHISQE